jgi:hypothetical protein
MRNVSVAGTINSSSFQAPVYYYLPYTIQTSNLFIQDLDMDGKNDVLIYGKADTFTIFKNTAVIGSISGTSFASAVHFKTNLNPFLTISGVNDMNGDGKPDILLFNSNNEYCMHNNSMPGTLTSSSFSVPLLLKSSHVLIQGMADLDGDGLPDFLLPGWLNDRVSRMNAKEYQGPQINNVYPNSAAPGDTIQILGNGFCNIPGSNVIRFGQVYAKGIKSTETTLSVIVPKG